MNYGKRPFFNTLMTLSCFLFLITAAVTLTVLCRPLYYIMLKLLKVPEESGYDYEICRRNYNILIDYNLLGGAKKLEFRDFAMSVRGEIHFAEVKRIFIFMQYAMIGTGILTFAGYLYSKKLRCYSWLKATIVLAVIIVVLAGAGFLFDWNGTFVLMHELLFDNDYWLFDPATDPIILVLPDGFFLACGVLILLLMSLGLLGCGLLYKKHHRAPQTERKRSGRKPGKAGKR